MNTADVLTTVDDDQTEPAEVWVCDNCGENVDDVSAIGDQDWCSDCIEEYARRCEDCDSLVPRDSLQRVQWRRVCDECLDDHYRQCDGCDCTYHTEELYCDENSDGLFCSTCYDERQNCDDDDANGLIREYSYKPEPIFHGGRGVIHYGVELEVNAPPSCAEDVINALDGERHVYLKEDSSVCGGFEIVTHPHTLDAHRTLWAGLFDDRRLINSMSAQDNGMHVHIQRSYLTRLQLQKMVVFINRPEHDSFIEFMADRSVKQWAAVDPYKANFNYKAYCGDRYTALNLCNARTAEVRIFRGTLDRDRLMANLQFCDALVGFCGNVGCRDLTVAQFANYVRGRGKQYRELDALLTGGGYLSAKPGKARTFGPVQETAGEGERVCV